MTTLSLRNVALAAALGLSAGASAIPFTYVVGTPSLQHYVYTGNNPAGPTSPMGVITSPFYKLATYNRPRWVLLKYLQQHYPAPYWSHSVDGDLSSGDSWLLASGYSPFGGVQGHSFFVGFNRLAVLYGEGDGPGDPDDETGDPDETEEGPVTNAPNPGAPIREYIFMERTFDYYGARRDIQVTGGSPYRSKWNPFDDPSGVRYQHALWVGPSLPELNGYNAINKKFIGNLFIVDRYVTPGHEHISIRDGYEFYTCYKQGGYAGTAMPSRPIDPEEDGGIVLE